MDDPRPPSLREPEHVTLDGLTTAFPVYHPAYRRRKPLVVDDLYASVAEQMRGLLLPARQGRRARRLLACGRTRRVADRGEQPIDGYADLVGELTAGTELSDVITRGVQIFGLTQRRRVRTHGLVGAAGAFVRRPEATVASRN
jgi:hypothetical protein